MLKLRSNLHKNGKQCIHLWLTLSICVNWVCIFTVCVNIYAHVCSGFTLMCKLRSLPQHLSQHLLPSTELAQVLPLLFFWKPVCAPLAPAMKAVNCWLWFHTDLESARQQSRAFAFKALKWRWNAKGLLCDWNWKYVSDGVWERLLWTDENSYD